MTRGVGAQQLGPVLGVAAFLGCSWTWCIGMYLPVILGRDYGPWAWVVFAVPNIVGAALMGPVLAKKGASEAFVQAHPLACWAFSLVTLTFQWFFFFWMALGIASLAWRVGLIGMVVGVFVLMHRPGAENTRTRALALVAWVVSAVLIGLAWVRGDLTPAPGTPLLGAFDGAGLGALAPVVAFGFLLCPYLDLTFHDARWSLAGGAGSRAFILGFGVLFAAMIGGTFLYARAILARAAEAGADAGPQFAPALVVLHIALQLAFTIVLHRSAMERWPSGGVSVGAGGGEREPPSHLSAGGMILGALLGAGLFWAPSYAGLGAHEVAYRCFMAFYGLVFPAYVWVCAWPVGKTVAPGRGVIAVFALAVLGAAPFYWLGFIERQERYLLIGLGIVLLARVLTLPMRGARGGARRVPAAR